jgi:hypothetical protein
MHVDEAVTPALEPTGGVAMPCAMTSMLVADLPDWEMAGRRNLGGSQT